MDCSEPKKRAAPSTCPCSCGSKSNPLAVNSMDVCKWDLCGCVRKRFPQLGRKDPLVCKIERAFTVQARQGIWDIGKPQSSVIHGVLKHTLFRTKFYEGLTPFFLDHNDIVRKLAWQTEIEDIDVILLMPELVHAMSDKDSVIAKVALMAILDILKHVSPVKVNEALPYFQIAIRNELRRNNDLLTRRMIWLLEKIISAQTVLVPNLALYARNFLLHMNRFVLRYPETKGDYGRIVYEDKTTPYPGDMMEPLIEKLELHAGHNRDRMEQEIKIAIPTYHSTRKSSSC